MCIVKMLNEKGATPETILQILKTSVFEISGDLSPDEMLAELISKAGESKIGKALHELREQPEAINEIALLWIAQAHETKEMQKAIEGAITDADREMPLMEIGAVTLIALYAIYRLTPNKAKSAKGKSIRQLPDGSFQHLEVDIKFDDFSAPVKGLLGLFSGYNADK